MITPARATVMADLKKRVQGLIHMDSVVKGVEEKFSAQESSIEQRLKWAAGANPALNPVLQNFEQTLAARKKLLAVSSKSCGFSLHFLVCFEGSICQLTSGTLYTAVELWGSGDLMAMNLH